MFSICKKSCISSSAFSFNPTKFGIYTFAGLEHIVNTTHSLRTKNNIQSIITKYLETLKYTVIKSKFQYNEYCSILEELIEKEDHQTLNDEIELLTVLIERWDAEHNTFEDSDPIELLQYLMTKKYKGEKFSCSFECK